MKLLAAKESKQAAIFQPEFRQDLRYWIKTDRNTAMRVPDLVEALLRDLFEGIGNRNRFSIYWQAVGHGELHRNTDWFTWSVKISSISYRPAIITGQYR